MVHPVTMAGRSLLSSLRLRERPERGQAQFHAVSVPGLPSAFQHQARNAHAVFQSALSDGALRQLSALHQPEEPIQNKARLENWRSPRRQLGISPNASAVPGTWIQKSRLKGPSKPTRLTWEACAIHILRKILCRYIHQQTSQNVSPTITDSRAGSLAAPQSWKMFCPRCVRKVAAVQLGRSMLIE